MMQFKLAQGDRAVLSPQALAYGAAALLAIGLAYDLLHMPLQVSDSLSLIVDASLSASPAETFQKFFVNAAYFRPLFYLQNKLLFDLANGHEALTYRLFQAILVGALLLAFVRALEIRDRVALVALPLALTVFVGIHTFLTNVRELYPTNHELEIALAVVVALNLAQSRGGLGRTGRQSAHAGTRHDGARVRHPRLGRAGRGLGRPDAWRVEVDGRRRHGSCGGLCRLAPGFHRDAIDV